MKKIASVVIVAIIIVGGYLAYSTYTNNNSEPLATKPQESETSGSAIVSANADSGSDTAEVSAPNGEAKAILESKSNQDGTRTYNLYTCTETCQDKKLIFTDKLPASEKLELPANSWSPDNMLLFVVKRANPTGYLVFNADGESFSEGVNYIDVATVFAEKQDSLKLRDVTGWDADRLMHVFTTTENGENGPSFWFEVPRGAFMQLGSR